MLCTARRPERSEESMHFALCWQRLVAGKLHRSFAANAAQDDKAGVASGKQLGHFTHEIDHLAGHIDFLHDLLAGNRSLDFLVGERALHH